jgi:hypothetical protein
MIKLRGIFLLGVFALFVVWMATAAAVDPEFRQYWYAGKAELTRYSLQQARYGQIHKGEAVLIFVTEPFLPDKQVKHESGSKKNAVSVLKLNSTRKFYTGLYPYSIMSSTFSPVDFDKHRTLKVSSSSQEWCGHTYMQLNYKNDAFDAKIHSYFENEADQNSRLPAGWLEDEIWTRIRLAPDTLPTGELQMVPALHYVRLWHIPLKSSTATASLKDSKDRSGAATRIYSVDYRELKRTVRITFEKQFPHAILSWEEVHPGGFRDSSQLTTRAVKTNTLLLDYWNKNQPKDARYRQQLGLTER